MKWWITFGVGLPALFWIVYGLAVLCAQNGTVQHGSSSQFIVLTNEERLEKQLIEVQMQLLVQQSENLRRRVCMREGVTDECGPWDTQSGNVRRMVKSAPPPPTPLKPEAAKPEVKKQP